VDRKESIVPVGDEDEEQTEERRVARSASKESTGNAYDVSGVMGPLQNTSTLSQANSSFTIASCPRSAAYDKGDRSQASFESALTSS
jgi:chitodextrinase